ncbi:MAG: response regulator [Byssovorax sp.]
MAGSRILIVEDERIIARDIEAQLVSLGYTPVGIAASADEALSLARAERPELVLMDIHLLGEVDGIDAARRLRGELGIPSVFLTAYANDDVLDRAKAANPLGYIIKPFDERSLRTTVEIALHKEQADALLRRSEARYRALIESAPDAIITADSEGRIVGWSPSAARLFGYEEHEILGQAATRVLTESHLARMQEHRESGGTRPYPTRVEIEGRHKDGHVLPLEASVARWSTTEGWFVTTFARDLRESKLLQAQLAQAQKMEVVGRLAGGVAHDFNNLLTVINGTAELVLSDLAKDDPLREEIEQIFGAGNQAARLTRQLLAFSRRQLLAPVAVNLATHLQGTARMLRRVIGEDIELVVQVDPSLEPIFVDPGQLEQVVLNLAVNARDAMPAGGALTIETERRAIDSPAAAQLLSLAPGDYVMLRVSDTGAGMSEDTLGRIFEPFFTTKPQGKGTGLGLATVHGIVTQSGGAVRVRSELGRGTTFELFFPRAPEAKPSPAATISVKPEKGSETILLVEDEAALRSISGRILRSAGYEVLLAADAQEALSLLEQPGAQVHMLFTDLVMPGLSGPELVLKVAALRPEIRVLFASGHGDDPRLEQLVQSSHAQFLAKPYSMTSLTQKVRAVLDMPPEIASASALAARQINPSSA